MPASRTVPRAETSSRVPGPTGPAHQEVAYRSRGRDLISWLVPPTLYLVASIALYSRFLGSPNAGAPGGADGVLYAWYFEHVEQSFAHLANPLFSTSLNAPEGINIMWNTAVLGIAVLLAPVTALFGPFTAVNVALTLAPVLSATAAYYAARRVTDAAWGAAALAASIYGFGPYFQGQSGHLHLIVAFFPPLLVVVGNELLVLQRASPLRTGIRLGVLTGVALLVSEEIVALSAVLAVFAVALLAALHPDEIAARLRYAVSALGIAVAAAVAVAGIPLSFQFFGPLALPGGVLPSTQQLDLAGLVRPSELQWFTSAADIRVNHTFQVNAVENTGYLGWPLLVLVVGVAVWSVLRGQRFGIWCLGTAAVAVVLALGSRIEIYAVDVGWGPWSVLRTLPLMDGAVAVRFTLFVTLLVALLLAWGLAQLRGPALLAGSAVVALTFVPLFPADRYDAQLAVRTPAFFTTGAVDVLPRGANVVLMPRGGSPDVQARGMAWQLRSGLRFDVIGGYSVFNQDGQMTYIVADPQFADVLRQVGESAVLPSPADIDAARPSIARSGAQFIVITDQQDHADLVAIAAERLTGCTVRRVSDVRLCEIPVRR